MQPVGCFGENRPGAYLGMLLGGTIGAMLPMVPDMNHLSYASQWAGVIGCVAYLQLRRTLCVSPEQIES